MNSYVAERFARERFVELSGEAAGDLRIRLAKEANAVDPIPTEPSQGWTALTTQRIIRDVRRVIDANRAHA